MKSRRLIWTLYPSYLLVVIVSIFLLGWYFLNSFSAHLHQQAREELMDASKILTASLKAQENGLKPASVDEKCKLYGEKSGYRFTVILPSGEVIGDSREDPEVMESHSNRPEVQAALSGESGSDIRYSETLRKPMLYVAAPYADSRGTHAIVRASLPLVEIRTAMHEMRTRLVVFALLLALLASGATILSTRRIASPLQKISKHSVDLGRGERKGKLPAYNIVEIDSLSKSINQMSDQLHERLSTVVRQRDEQNALFACMSESVLAVDTERRIIRLNAAARKLFEIEPGDSRGRKVSEVIRHAELLDIIEKTLQGSDIVEGDIVMHDSDTCLQAHGSPLLGADGEKLGALIVLNDITRLRRLEVMRKDFVANVSHELKTPITSIRGFLDTLIDTPDEKVEERKRFMDIISQQVDRLQAIVEDLLTFSNLEHEVGTGKVELHESAIYPVLSNSIQICRDKAEKRNITINLNADRSITNKVNTQLLERAVTNLIDNAIKYGDEGTTIDVSLEKEEKHLAIRVKDQGIGIPHVHQSRIFERFYCVDKSRSRKLGGTGLGLAIVKHVAIAHRGKVEVESEVEKGSTFSILLPPE